MNVYSFSIRLATGGPVVSPQGPRQLNSAAETPEEAIAKVRQANPGCEVQQVNKICQIDIP